MKKRPRDYERDELICEFPYEDNNFSVVSSCECTGLVSEIPFDGDEVRSYKDIYDIPLEPYSDSKERR